MGVIQYFKNKIQNYKYATMLSGRYPIFSQFGDNIYASDIVQSIIDCIVSEMTKLNPQHIKRVGTDYTPINDNIAEILKHPNELMTKTDFMSKVIWNLFLNYNSIIYPVYKNVKYADGTEKKKYIALYPLQPKKVEFLNDDKSQLYIRMTFKNQSVLTLPYEEVIHIRYKYSFNEYLGGNANGQPDNEALLKLLSMDNNLMEGVLKAMKTSFQINGFVKAPAFINDDEKEKMIKEFEEQFNDNKSGLIGLDAKAEFIPISNKINPINPNILKFIDERILRQYGVSLPILTGDYTKEQYEAFYQKKLEPLIIAMSEAFTKGLFTLGEKQRGHEIIFLPQPLIFLNSTQTLEAIRILGDRGEIWSNEGRIAMGFPPLPELEGVRMQSLNYIDSKYAIEYQLKNNAGETTSGTDESTDGAEVQNDNK